MNLYPFFSCARQADELIRTTGALVYQQFNCEHCGTKQTMDVPNKFYTKGDCEECKKTTDIRKNGCNYMVHYGKH